MIGEIIIRKGENWENIDVNRENVYNTFYALGSPYIVVLGEPSPFSPVGNWWKWVRKIILIPK